MNQSEAMMALKYHCMEMDSKGHENVDVLILEHE